MPAVTLFQLAETSFDDLDFHFSSLKLEDKRDHYQLGKVVRPPLRTMCSEVSGPFLTSPEGKMLWCVVKELIKSKRLLDTTPSDFFERLNRSFEDGTCLGEAQAIMLSRRPKSTEDSQEKRFQEFVDAIFFQVQHEMSFFQNDDLVLQLRRLFKEKKGLDKKNLNLQKEIKRLNSKKEQLLQALNTLKTNPKKNKKRASLIKWRKKQVKVLHARLLEQQDKQAYTASRLKQVVNKITRLYEKVQALDDFKCQLDQAAQNKWTEKKLTVFKEARFARHSAPQDSYLLGLEKQLTKAFSNKTASDFLLTFSDDNDDTKHTILVQPSHPRIYDANVGEILYDTIHDIVFDLQHYSEDNDVNCIDIQFIKEG